MRPTFRIESLLSARLFVAPQRVGNRLYFISNLSGQLSLYAMHARDGGSVPEPLLPPDIALMTPELMDGHAFTVFPALNKILVMLDRDGDEAYQPMLISIEGGYPEPAFGEHFVQSRVRLLHADEGRSIVYLHAEPRDGTGSATWQCNLITGGLVKLGESQWGSYLGGVNADHTKAVLIDGYTVGDHALYLWTKAHGERTLLYGTPLEARAEGEAVTLNAISACFFTPRDRGLLFITALFSDAYGLGYFTLDNPGDVKPVRVTGLKHKGAGELVGLEHLKGNRYAVKYNIDGCSWLYEGAFDERALKMTLDAVICGRGETVGGVLESSHYDKAGNRFALSFSTATTPTQLFTVSKARSVQHTRERVVGIPANWLSKGEDASFTSHDGLRVSARLYLPAKALKYEGPRPVVYYIHGGPQGQERPDFAWFSMPIIQFLALNGFAVFVPNARGSTGYGLSYTKRVDKDWGGQDRLDHVHAMTQVLPRDKRLDASRAGVVGRSYGGYMTLTLAARHPELWSAAVDMFGPYDLFTFMERIPDAWKPYFSIAIGDPVKDRDLLVERSPRTYIDQIACPLLVIQGKNDPRVVERESRDVVEQLQAQGKQVDYLMFEDEGHDVLKFANRVRCYTAITDFFKEHLRP
jgi:pimeloyl-ACP methyl ester carboxylesterase